MPRCEPTCGTGESGRKTVVAEISDITPAHEPISLAKEMVERAPGCKAALCVLVKADGKLWYDMSGHERVYIMWALQRMVNILMTEEG